MKRQEMLRNGSKLLYGILCKIGAYPYRNRYFLKGLQRLHDDHGHDRRAFEDHAESFCNKWGLKYTPPVDNGNNS